MIFIGRTMKCSISSVCRVYCQNHRSFVRFSPTPIIGRRFLSVQNSLPEPVAPISWRSLAFLGIFGSSLWVFYQYKFDEQVKKSKPFLHLKLSNRRFISFCNLIAIICYFQISSIRLFWYVVSYRTKRRNNCCSLRQAVSRRSLRPRGPQRKSCDRRILSREVHPDVLWIQPLPGHMS